jgi:hypothetical protein
VRDSITKKLEETGEKERCVRHVKVSVCVCAADVSSAPCESRLLTIAIAWVSVGVRG